MKPKSQSNWPVASYIAALLVTAMGLSLSGCQAVGNGSVSYDKVKAPAPPMAADAVAKNTLDQSWKYDDQGRPVGFHSEATSNAAAAADKFANHEVDAITAVGTAKASESNTGLLSLSAGNNDSADGYWVEGMWVKRPRNNNGVRYATNGQGGDHNIVFGY